ncbi:MAG: amidohydrolase family protein [Planctomycetaceae bacterium]|nr:amidohydrolase family protein [Planctomycetaceae bacterium]
MLIDSHHHLWKYSTDQYGWISDQMLPLKADFLLPELQQTAAESSIDGFVSVQARQSLQETDDLLAMAETEPLIAGVVGWVPLAAPEIGQTLERLGDQKFLKGVRHVVQDEEDDRFILGTDFNRGVSQLKTHNLVYDVLIFAKQLPASIEFVDQHPNLQMVLDHIAKPTITADAFDNAWEMNFRELAKRGNISCKFSGVVTEVRGETWSIDQIQRYWDVALEAFTPDRLMFGSDWPVCLLKTGHTQWLETVQQLASDLSVTERNKIFSTNAIRDYNLDIEAN